MDFRARAWCIVAAGLAGWCCARAARGEGLADAWAAALADNQRVAASRSMAASAESQLRAAQADRLPTVTGQGLYQGLTSEPAIRVPDTGGLLPFTQLPYAQDAGAAALVQARLPLYTGGRIQSQIDAAQSRLCGARKDSERSDLDVKLAVADAYVAVLRFQRAVETAASNVRTLDAHSRDVQRFFEQQSARRTDLLAAQVTLAHATQQEIQARNNLELARASYNRLLGRPLSTEVKIDELPLLTIPDALDPLTARALERRPEIASLAAQTQALRQDAAAVAAGRMPQVEMRGGFGYDQDRFQEHEGIGFLGVVVEWNGYDGGRRSSQAQALDEQADASARTLADTKSQVALDVQHAWLDVRETRERLQVSRQAIAQADENLRVSRERFLAGMGTNTEVLDAESLRVQSYRDLHQSTYDAVMADLRLRRATGDL